MSDFHYAIVFPGQGVQEVGMGRDFNDVYAVSRGVFDEADEALGFKLSKIIFKGPEDELTKTALTQPAILVTSVAVLRAVEHEIGHELRPKFYAGHSLGEYTALVVDGVLSLGDAVRLVHKRGALMQDAVPLGEGAMAAVMGLDMATISEVCAMAAEEEVCGPANLNSPNQIVISGNAGAVIRAGKMAKARGASKVILLKVSAPFHCVLMHPVADKLMEAFASCEWREPKVPIMANADASAKESAEAIKTALYEQTYRPVLWADGVLSMAGAGVKCFAEFGPGNVLSGLIKRTAKGVPTLAVNKVADIAQAIDFLNGAA
ncbi:MAG: ACP S-malonyltransferase [Synergistaceae bacterium]|jgi:[acyl-carrier-protein] S-malonyltransferase|nr:ACP S-malonyltransferase [Synergistaceae bacterium]